MQIVFFGTPDFAKEILEYLISRKIDVVAVVTQPDSVNRKRVSGSAVKEYISHTPKKIPVFQPEKSSCKEFIQELKKLSPDLFVVVAYGQILKQELLDVPKLGAINVHASLLPRLRGAAPIQRAILNGEKETGITIMRMALKMDAGNIIAQEKIAIGEMNFDALKAELCEIAKPLLLQVIRQYESGKAISVSQDEKMATYADKISVEDRLIDWQKEARVIFNQVRAFATRPGAFCKVIIGKEEKILKILRCKVKNLKLKPKEFINGKREFVVGCKDYSLEVYEVQLEGKKVMAAEEFLRGLQLEIVFL